MFDFLKSDLEIIRAEAVHFLTKNLGLTKATAKSVSLNIDNDAANYLIAITPKPDVVMKSIRKIIAAELAYRLHPDQESELIKAIGTDMDYVLKVEIPMSATQGNLSTTAMSNSAVLSGLIKSYISELAAK